MTPVKNSDTKTVCLVDDDPLVLASLEQLLRSYGFSVRSFNNPKSFLAYAQAHPVPVVVLDIWMDEMSGLEVQAHLCALSPSTRVIIMTGRKNLSANLTALHLGVVAFFTKPFDSGQFLSVMHRALAMHSIQ